MPFHKGHAALVDFALKKCNKVIVAVCSSKTEPIPGKVRYAWVKQIYNGNPSVIVKHVWADLPHNPIPTKKGTATWANYLIKRFPDADTVVSSEDYGVYMASVMGVSHIMFDKHRKKVRISGTMIRSNPDKYEQFVDQVAKSSYRAYL